MKVSRRLAVLFARIALAAGLAFLAGCDRGGAPRWIGHPDGVSTVAPERLEQPSPALPVFAPGQLEQHFLKHGAEMGFATALDYLRAAQAVVAGGPGVETLQRGGDTLFFNEATDEFAVLSDRRVIRTYFKPDDGPRYWERQKER